jgi:hypothetical protein
MFKVRGKTPNHFHYRRWSGTGGLLPRSKILIRWLSVILIMLPGLSACLPAAAPLPPEPTDTMPPPTQTSTPTVVWFPPTPTVTPFPTPVITPTVDLSPPVGELMLSDDFTSPGPWSLGQTSTTSIALGPEALTLAMTQPGAYLYTLRREPTFSDFYVEVTASPSLCRNADEYGLLLRFTSSQEFYRFSLSCDGQLRLDKYFNGRASSPQPWMLSGQVPPGAPSSSRIAVWAKGKEMRFYVNGVYQFTANDPSIPAGNLGFFARSAGDNAVTISFSDLEVYKVPN